MAEINTTELQRQEHQGKVTTGAMLAGMAALAAFGQWRNKPRWTPAAIAKLSIPALGCVIAEVRASKTKNIDNPELRPRVDECYTQVLDEAGTGRAPRLTMREGDKVNAYAIGNANPRIFLFPKLVTLLPDAQLKGVIAHELAHIRSYDTLTLSALNFLSVAATHTITEPIVAAATSKNPAYGRAVRIASTIVHVAAVKKLARTREAMADTNAVRFGTNPSDLAKMLLNLNSTGRISAPPPLLIPLLQLFSSHPTIAQRIERMQRLVK